MNKLRIFRSSGASSTLRYNRARFVEISVIVTLARFLYSKKNNIIYGSIVRNKNNQTYAEDRRCLIRDGRVLTTCGFGGCWSVSNWDERSDWQLSLAMLLMLPFSLARLALGPSIGDAHFPGS